MIGLDDKKGHIAALLKLAKADGTISQHEANLIKMIAIRMGISSSDFNEIVLNLESANSIPPATREEKEMYLFQVFTLMKVDLKTDEAEQKICEELGIRLGFNTADVQRTAEFMRENLHEVVSFHEFKRVLDS